MLAEIMRHMTENLIMMPLFYDSKSVMISNRMVNVNNSTQRGSEAGNIGEWDLRTP